MLTNPILARVIERESTREILELLAPGQFVVAALRADGLNDQEIGDLLGLTRQSVSARIRKAAKTIRTEPDLAPHIAGRTKRYRPTAHPHDAIQNPNTSGDLTTGQVARLYKVSPVTVYCWIRDGRLPNAFQTPSGRWRIPHSDLDGFFPPGKNRRWT